MTEQAIEILERTQDGDALAPAHLALLQGAVNGNLNAEGRREFVAVHRDVMAGKYHPPWLQGVEHLTRDHAGFVYWKGQQIEHWSGDMPYSEEGRAEAEELARRCRILEERGEPINCGSVVWRWEE